MARRIRQLMVILGILTLGLMVASCTAPEKVLPPTATAVPTVTQGKEAQPEPVKEPTAVHEGFPLTFTDDLGRNVTLDDSAERVISLAPNLTEMLFAVGAGDQVVGVTSFCDYPEAALSRPQVGGFSSDTISVEQIIALEPDLVLSTGGYQLETIEALEQLDITVVAFDPNSIEAILAAMQAIGDMTGHGDRATHETAAMQQRIDQVAAMVASVPSEERVSVYWQIWDEPLMSVGAKAFPGQLIELAGGQNIFGDSDDFYPTVSAEEVVARNPQVIMGPDTHGEKLTAESFRQRPGWAEIDAVVNERIYVIEDDIVARAGPRVVSALEAIAEALYPERFTE